MNCCSRQLYLPVATHRSLSGNERPLSPTNKKGPIVDVDDVWYSSRPQQYFDWQQLSRKPVAAKLQLTQLHSRFRQKLEEESFIGGSTILVLVVWSIIVRKKAFSQVFFVTLMVKSSRQDIFRCILETWVLLKVNCRLEKCCDLNSTVALKVHHCKAELQKGYCK